MESQTNAVTTCNTHSEAEEAVKDLGKSGMDIKKLSIVDDGYRLEEHVVGYYTTGDRMKQWAVTGAIWGWALGFLVGAASSWFPGFGFNPVSGPFITWLLAAFEGAVVGGGLGAVGAGLYGMSMPKNSVLRYETAWKAGKYLLIAYGSADEVARARAVLGTAHADAMARPPAGFVAPAESSHVHPMHTRVCEKDIRRIEGSHGED